MNLFPGFTPRRIRTSGATINLVVGGKGPPVLLLHGYPETHAMWHKVAPQLARDYTVVCADLRGYGDSSKPRGVPGHANYSKRAMARDMAEVMRELGYLGFHVVGHDRGGRVAPSPGARLSEARALDHRARHLAHAEDVPEHQPRVRQGLLPLVLPDPAGAAARAPAQGHVPWYILSRLGRGPSKLQHFDKRAVAEYVRVFKDPAHHPRHLRGLPGLRTIDLVMTGKAKPGSRCRCSRCGAGKG
jgi:haloacetate dehalogenase